MTALYELYDSDQPLDIPLGVKAAGYDDGYAAFPPYDWLGVGFQRFPDALHITVIGKTSSDVADVETGDLTPTAGCQWALARKQLGKTGIVYVNRANGHLVESGLRTVGVLPGEALLWIATDDGTQTVTVWDDGSPVTYPVFAVQYLNQAAGSGGHYDRSLVYIAFGGGGGTITEDEMTIILGADLTPGGNAPLYVLLEDQTTGKTVKRHISYPEFVAYQAGGVQPRVATQATLDGIPDWTASGGGTEPPELTTITLNIPSVPGTATGKLTP